MGRRLRGLGCLPSRGATDLIGGQDTDHVSLDRRRVAGQTQDLDDGQTQLRAGVQVGQEPAVGGGEGSGTGGAGGGGGEEERVTDGDNGDNNDNDDNNVDDDHYHDKG